MMSIIDNFLRTVLETLDTISDADEKTTYAQRWYHKAELTATPRDVSVPFIPQQDDLYHRTHALALAIATANLAAVENLLPYWKTRLDSPDAMIWGYRELYSFFHLACDPNGHNIETAPINIARLTEPTNISVLTDEGNRVKTNLICIIQLLAAHGTTLDLRPKIAPYSSVFYQNPAIAGGEARGYGALPDAILIPLALEWTRLGGKMEDGTWFRASTLQEKIVAFKADITTCQAQSATSSTTPESSQEPTAGHSTAGLPASSTTSNRSLIIMPATSVPALPPVSSTSTSGLATQPSLFSSSSLDTSPISSETSAPALPSVSSTSASGLATQPSLFSLSSLDTSPISSETSAPNASAAATLTSWLPYCRLL